MFFKAVLVCAIIATAYAVPKPSKINTSLDWKVVGGSTAEDGQFPYIISLRYFGSHICGGSIINENWVVTAAHCVEDGSTSGLTVVTGTNTLNNGGDSYNLETIVVNNQWDSWNLVNDIALLKVSSPIVMSSTVQAIPLETQDVGAGADAVLCGWGTTSYPGDIPNDLQFIDLKTVSVAECQDAHSPNAIYDSQVCTFTRQGEGACHGDSGGPLASNGRLIGIVSWGRPCAAGYPDVFTRVSAFNSWINNNIA